MRTKIENPGSKFGTAEIANSWGASENDRNFLLCLGRAQDIFKQETGIFWEPSTAELFVPLNHETSWDYDAVKSARDRALEIAFRDFSPGDCDNAEQ